MHFLAAAAVLLASYGAGMVLTGGGRALPGGLRGRATAFALGFGALQLLALGLGQAGAFTPRVLGSVAVAAGAAGAVFAARDAPRLASAWRRAGRERWALAAAAGIAAYAALLASAPPTSADAIAYHLTAPKLWLAEGRMFPIWWDWLTFMPFATEMHLAYGHALAGGRAAMVVGAGLTAFSAVCVYGLARELASPRVGAAAALLWVGQGMFLWQASGAFVEMVVAGLLALSAWHLAAFARSRRLPDAAWAGLAAGLALSGKYHALAIVPALALAAPVLARGRPAGRAAAAAAFAGAAAVVLPWYVRNGIVTGDPLYPLLADRLNAAYWSPSAAAVLRGLRDYPGVDGLWRLPILPLEFVRQPERFDRPYTYGPALFALAPLALALSARWVKVLALSVLAYAVVWFELMGQVDRFLLFVVPALAVLAGTGALRGWQAGGWLRRYTAAAAALSAAALVAMAGLFGAQVAPVLVGAESEARHVQRLTGTYDAFAWLEENLPPEGRVLVGVLGLYWLDRPYVRWSVPLFGGLDPAPLMERRMRANDVRYVAFVELPPQFRQLPGELRPIARLPFPEVTSRVLGRTVERTLVVHAWCPPDAQGWELCGER